MHYTKKYQDGMVSTDVLQLLVCVRCGALCRHVLLLQLLKLLSNIKLCPPFTNTLQVRCKFKSNEEKVIHWWFLVRGDEAVLADLESCWPG